MVISEMDSTRGVGVVFSNNGVTCDNLRRLMGYFPSIEMECRTALEDDGESYTDMDDVGTMCACFGGFPSLGARCVNVLLGGNFCSGWDYDNTHSAIVLDSPMSPWDIRDGYLELERDEVRDTINRVIDMMMGITRYRNLVNIAVESLPF